jgi:hypothetical protein
VWLGFAIDQAVRLPAPIMIRVRSSSAHVGFVVDKVALVRTGLLVNMQAVNFSGT